MLVRFTLTSLMVTARTASERLQKGDDILGYVKYPIVSCYLPDFNFVNVTCFSVSATNQKKQQKQLQPGTLKQIFVPMELTG